MEEYKMIKIENKIVLSILVDVIGEWRIKDKVEIPDDFESIELTYLKDGVYDISDLEFLIIGTKDIDEKLISDIEDFVTKHPDFVVANPYQVEYPILISKKPNKYTGKGYGSWFNHGSSNIITNCPNSILILAQND